MLLSSQLIENGTTMITFDLRKLNFQRELGTTFGEDLLAEELLPR